MPTCDGCYKRLGELVAQHVVGPLYLGGGLGIQEAFVFRYYLCRWCRGVENRRRDANSEHRTVVLEFRTDEEVLREIQDHLV